MDKDTIFFKGMTFYGYHGVYPEETRLGQRFVVIWSWDWTWPPPPAPTI